MTLLLNLISLLEVKEIYWSKRLLREYKVVYCYDDENRCIMILNLAENAYEAVEEAKKDIDESRPYSIKEITMISNH